MTQPELFPGRKPRTDWGMVEALGTLEWFLAEADRLGLTGFERDQWARNKTWERMEYHNGKPENE